MVSVLAKRPTRRKMAVEELLSTAHSLSVLPTQEAIRKTIKIRVMCLIVFMLIIVMSEYISQI